MQGKVLTDRLCKMGCLYQGITFDDYSTPFSFKIYNLNYCDYTIKIWCFKSDDVVFVSNTNGAGFEWKKEMDTDEEHINKFMQWIKNQAVKIRYNNMEKDFVK